MDRILDRALSGERISPPECLELLSSGSLPRLASVANAITDRRHSPRIRTYGVDRNINYTNVCTALCDFCAFYRVPGDPESYVLPFEAIGRKIEETIAAGGAHILMQGGLHPRLGLDWYRRLLGHIRTNYPSIHIHAFSPPEVVNFSRVFRMAVPEVLSALKEAGLGSIPGGGAEILTDRSRERISPFKCTADEWISVMREAHRLGLRTTATMMFGHGESLEERVEHLVRIRSLQDETGGFTAFICWTYQPDHTRLRGREAGPHSYLSMLAVSRIFLDNVENLQASWVTQGEKLGQLALHGGANDFGTTMLEENVVSAAGATYRMTRDQMVRAIEGAGFQARKRDILYRILEDAPDPAVAAVG